MKNLLQPHNLYGNICVFSPDGKPMFSCSQKRANWYLTRGLAKETDAVYKHKLSGSYPIKAIKLTFEPNGLGHYSDPDLLEQQNNICCVCGSEKDLVKNYIIPREYFIHFPLELKSRNWMNKIMLCIDCAKIHTLQSRKLRDLIAELTKTPIDGINSVVDKRAKYLAGIANGLLQTKNVLPEIIKQAYLKIISDHLGHNPSQEELISIRNMKTLDQSKFICHGQVVAEKIVDFKTFMNVWRNHFMQTMQPKFPPSHLRKNENQGIL